MGNFFSNLLAPKASHKEFIKFVVESKQLIQQAEALKKDGGTNNRTHVLKHGGKSRLSKVNQPTTPSRRDHVEMFKGYEGFLKTKKAKRLYGEPFVKQALTGLRNIRKGDKRFEVELLHCVDGFVDPDAYKTMWRERSETATLFCHNVDALNALAEQGFTKPENGVRFAFAEEAKRNVGAAHQQAVARAKLFKLTCLPQANADSVSPTQTELANWLNKAFAAHPDLKEFRASSFVDALFVAYPNKIMELNRELDDLYAQLQAGNHDSTLLTQISNVGQQQAACIERYVRKLALVGQLLSDQFPWEEAPFGSMGIAVTAGHDLNRLAEAHLANGSPMMEMHRFAIKAQAQVFAIQHGGQAAPSPAWADAVKQATLRAHLQIDRLMDEMTPTGDASELTPDQREFSDWLKDGMAKPSNAVIDDDLSKLLDVDWRSLNELDAQLAQLIHCRQAGEYDANLRRKLHDTGATLVARIDRYLGGVDALRRLALLGADNKKLSSAQRKLLIDTSHVLLRLVQRLKDPASPLMAIYERALAEEIDAKLSSDARRQQVVKSTVEAKKAYTQFEDVLFNSSSNSGKPSDAQVRLRQWMTDQLQAPGAPTEGLSLTFVSANIFTHSPEKREMLRRSLDAAVKSWKESGVQDLAQLRRIGRTAAMLIRQIDDDLAQIQAVGTLLIDDDMKVSSIELEERRAAAGDSMLRLWNVLTHPAGDLMKLRQFAQQTQREVNERLGKQETKMSQPVSGADLSVDGERGRLEDPRAFDRGLAQRKNLEGSLTDLLIASLPKLDDGTENESRSDAEGRPQGGLRAPRVRSTEPAQSVSVSRTTLTANWELGSSHGVEQSDAPSEDPAWNEELEKALNGIEAAVSTPAKLRPAPTRRVRSKDTASVHPAVQKDLDVLLGGLQEEQFHVAINGQQIPGPELTDADLERQVDELTAELERDFRQ